MLSLLVLRYQKLLAGLDEAGSVTYNKVKLQGVFCKGVWSWSIINTHLSRHATLKHFCSDGGRGGAGDGSLSCRMELIKVVGERGVSAGKVDPAPTSTSTGHTSSTSETWVGLNGSSFTCTNGLVLLKSKRGVLLSDQQFDKNISQTKNTKTFCPSLLFCYQLSSIPFQRSKQTPSIYSQIFGQ